MIPDTVSNLIEELSKLPGVGPKTASRLAFWLLSKPDSDVKNLGQSILNLKSNLKTCSICCNITQQNPCKICKDSKRDHSKICVVEEPLDVVAIEKTGYNGLYHVLGGVISPVDGIGPENLNIKPLLDRVKVNRHNISEVILATDPTLEGEATAMYIWQQLKPLGLKVTRIARGLPVGGDLEYADEITLNRAFEGRKDFQ